MWEVVARVNPFGNTFGNTFKASYALQLVALSPNSLLGTNTINLPRDPPLRISGQIVSCIGSYLHSRKETHAAADCWQFYQVNRPALQLFWCYLRTCSGRINLSSICTGDAAR